MTFEHVLFFTIAPDEKYDQIFTLTKSRELCYITDKLFLLMEILSWLKELFYKVKELT